MSAEQRKSSTTAVQTGKEFRDLTTEELKRGYIWSQKEESYICIFCGQVFEDGVVFPEGARLLSAEKAVKQHVVSKHGGAFMSLLSMDKQINGLSDIQKTIMQSFYADRGTDEICGIMGITPATVRTHKHNLQRLKREAKIFLALIEQIEDEDRAPLTAESQDQDRPDVRPSFGSSGLSNTPGGSLGTQAVPAVSSGAGSIPGDFSGNTLHPFFTKCRFE